MEIHLSDYIYMDDVIDVRVGEYKAVISNDFIDNKYNVIFTEPTMPSLGKIYEIPNVINPDAVTLDGYGTVSIYPRIGTFIIEWDKLKKIR